MVQAIPKQTSAIYLLTVTLFTAALLCFLLPRTGFAQQADFALRDYGYKTGYAYSWRDHHGRQHTTRFHLDSDMVKKASNEFKPFSNNDANSYVYKTVKNYASRLRSRGISMSVSTAGSNGKVEIVAKGTSRQALQRELDTVDGLIEQSRKKYIRNKLFRMYDENSVVPDHARIAGMYASRMRPVARALEKSAPRGDLRGQINHTLAFLQGIPYDELLNRRTSSGSGFATPVELITRNLGDCDSKSVAMASILKNSHPNVPMVLVLIEGHAFVGVAGVRRGSGDFGLKINNRTYILAEPAGPSLMPLGQIDRRSKRLLRSGDFQHVQL